MNKIITSFICFSAVLQIPAFAAIRIGNASRSYAEDYNQIALQVAAANEAATTTATDTTDSLPITVNDEALKTAILNGTSTDVNTADLESCAMIYPSGKFAWDKPNAGGKNGSSPSCVSVVEMRVLNGTEDIVVARANIASGDTVKCNISNFPESGYTNEAGTVIFPADNPPTIEQVQKVMDKEQKKNAGIKIAAGIIVGGLAGNAAGENDRGKDDIIGTDKGKMQSAAIGALSGGALMAGNSYAGKVGGDVILSTGVNAAAGAVVGNMMQIGDSVLKIEDCDINGRPTTCLWGTLEKYKTLETGETAYYNTANDETWVCKTGTDGKKTCDKTNLIGLSFNTQDTKTTVYNSVAEGKKDNNFIKITKRFRYDSESKLIKSSDSNDDSFIQIKDGGRPGKRVNAMIEFTEKTFGSKIDDWNEWQSKNYTKTDGIYGRRTDGKYTDLPNDEKDEKWSIRDFHPLTVDVDDGNIIDLNNKARLKGTLIGAGTGASLGAITAYQGAQDEITQRWISATTEYKDSLQKVYCATGTRFLSSYNDTVIIPNMTATE